MYARVRLLPREGPRARTARRLGTHLLVLLAGVVAFSTAAQAADADKLQIRGFLTQAYAEATDVATQGIPTDGTFDYRSLAVLFRYQVNDDMSMVVQLEHEENGIAAADEFRDEIELGWAYVEFDFGKSSLRVGRAPRPFGIYNEIRDVGPLLPFFRPPTAIYSDSGFSLEGVDGAVLSHSFASDSAWNLDANLYVGEWSNLDTSNRQMTNELLGLRVWLNTPYQGLGFGAGYEDSDAKDGGSDLESVILSAEGAVGRVEAKAEYRSIDFEGGGFDAGYVYVGFELGGGFSLNLQHEQSELALTVPFFGATKSDLLRDHAVGLNYAWTPATVLKLEHHWGEGFSLDEPPPDFTTRFFSNRPFDTNYFILSFSVAY